MALTAEQVDAYDLPQVERRDKRDYQVRLVVECEAMPQGILLGLVEDTAGVAFRASCHFEIG